MAEAWTETQEILVESLWSSGLTAAEIAKHLPGRSRNSIGSWLDQHGFKRSAESAKLTKALRVTTLVAPVVYAPVPISGALAGSSPRPWETRRRVGECAWPIDSDDGVLSCCLPVWTERPYCKGHCKVAYVKPLVRK